MAKGDHIKVDRGLYQHHGIDLGDSTVVHYTGELLSKIMDHDAPVKRTTMEEFKKKGKIKKVVYSQYFSRNDVILRALSRLGESKYNLVFNNCEHFARWCKTGDKKSDQVNDAKMTAFGTFGTLLFSYASKPLLSAIGAKAGLSGPGILSSLAKIGPRGAVGGIGTLSIVPSLIVGLAIDKGILKDDKKLSEDEREARKAGRMAAKISNYVTSTGTIATISASGAVTGLSGPGIACGLGYIGSMVGGGMLAGTVICITAPAVVAGVTGLGAYKVLKKNKKTK